MTSDNPTADRLLSDARKKSQSADSPLFAQIAVGLGVVGVISGALIYLAGWVLGAIAIGLAGLSMKRGAAAKLAKIGVILGVAAILVATFCYTLSITSGPWWTLL